MINVLVKYYIRRFDRELEEVRYHTPQCQSRQLLKILNSPLVHRLNPQLVACQNENEFKSMIAISSYDQYQDQISELITTAAREIEYYAQSSGTTSGVQKLIPTPESFVRANHLRGSWYILNTLYNHVEGMNVFNAKNLLVGGSIYHRSHNYLIGDVSGIMLNRIPQFFRPYYIPKISEAIIPDWQKKLSVTIRKASVCRDVSLLAGVPTWLLAVLSGVQERIAPRSLSEHWPNLRAYLHGGVSMSPYQEQFKSLIEKPDFKYIEVYNATEGFFAFQDDPDEDGMLLMTHSGIYFEFIGQSDYTGGVGDQILGFEDLQLGAHYVLLISTMTGLLRYVLGDIIQIVNLNPYKIKVVGRISEYVNAFGEDLMLWQAQEALMKTAKQHKVSLSHFAVAPKYISTDEKGWHDWAVEFVHPPEHIDSFESDLDQHIQDINNNYKQKRYGSIAMNRLKVHSLRSGTFNAYLKSIGKQGGQSKIQKLRNDRFILDQLLKINHV